MLYALLFSFGKSKLMNVCLFSIWFLIFMTFLLCIQESSDRGKEIEYVVKRLIRGLASSRECARIGFSTVLTHVRLRSNSRSALFFAFTLYAKNCPRLCFGISPSVMYAHFSSHLKVSSIYLVKLQQPADINWWYYLAACWHPSDVFVFYEVV